MIQLATRGMMGGLANIATKGYFCRWTYGLRKAIREFFRATSALCRLKEFETWMKP